MGENASLKPTVIKSLWLKFSRWIRNNFRTMSGADSFIEWSHFVCERDEVNTKNVAIASSSNQLLSKGCLEYPCTQHKYVMRQHKLLTRPICIMSALLILCIVTLTNHQVRSIHMRAFMSRMFDGRPNGQADCLWVVLLDPKSNAEPVNRVTNQLAKFPKLTVRTLLLQAAVESVQNVLPQTDRKTRPSLGAQIDHSASVGRQVNWWRTTITIATYWDHGHSPLHTICPNNIVR